MWDSLQNIIPKVANKYKFAKALKAIEICREYRNLAPRFLPAESSIHTDAKSYKDRTLTLTAVNSAWAEQIQRNKHRITEAINRKFGEETIKKINIQLSSGRENEAWLDQ
jgi:predicted nucleic acid-binding Zn ribbon protein